MVIRLAVSRAAVGLFVAGGLAVSGEALAQANVLKECGSQYQAAKAANELGGQSWQDFLKACRARLLEQKEAAPAPAPAETKPAEAAPPPAAEAPAPTVSPPAAAPAPQEAKPAPAPAEAKTPKAAKASQQSRQKKCSAEWKAKKAELTKSDPKMTWPKFWSSCNKRMKEAGE